jgi:hypothetical protein
MLATARSRCRLSPVRSTGDLGTGRKRLGVRLAGTGFRGSRERLWGQALWGVPLWDGLMVAIEEKQSSLTRCVVVMALGGVGAVGALEKVRRSECPNGAPHTSPG